MKFALRTAIAAGLCVASALVIAPPAGAATESFTGANTGAIPDGGGSPFPNFGPPRNVTFNVAGLTAPATDIELALTIDHTYMGDLDVVLVAPDATEFVIFSRVGATTADGAGRNSNLGGTYTFSDAATLNFWTATVGNSNFVAPSGSYRTSGAGGAGQVDPAPNTDFTAAFAGVADLNGTWTVRVRDGAGVDTGSVTAATLTIKDSAAGPARTTPTTDFDGDGKDDYSIVREVGGSVAWWNLDSTGGSAHTATFGTAATDFVVPADYDGDGKVDRAVWRNGANGVFYIEESSTLNVRVVPFGVSGDIATVVGDWDGDGKADPAVWRESTGIFYYLGSANNPGNNTTYLRWGTAGDRPIPADYDGDGRLDAAVARNVGGQNQIWILRSSNSGAEVLSFGLWTDSIVPGDYDGDGLADLMMVRNNGGSLVWWLLTRTGSTSVAQFGAATDFPLTGDYDGDGKTDRGVYRPSTGQFWVLRSSDFGLQIGTFGTAGDSPLANAFVK